MTTTDIFKNHERLIYKQAWYYTHKYGMDFEDVKSQAFLIFCEAMNRFDENRGAGFGTFLFHRLRTLNDYCRAERAWLHSAAPLDENTPDEREFFDLALDAFSGDELSEDARELSCALFAGDFEAPELKRQRRPGRGRIAGVLRKRGWDQKRAENALFELQEWWEKN